jgi:hypothetical protein
MREIHELLHPKKAYNHDELYGGRIPRRFLPTAKILLLSDARTTASFPFNSPPLSHSLLKFKIN